MSRRSSLVAAVGLAVAGFALVPVSPAAAAACSGTSGVTVVVGSSVSCAPGDPSSALAALRAAGHSTTMVQRFPGALCRIDGAPSTDPCVNMPPASAYWAFYHAPRGGSWTYSQVGVTSYDPAPGTVIGFAFGAGARPGVAPPAATAPPPPPPPSPRPAPTTAKPAPTTSRPAVTTPRPAATTVAPRTTTAPGTSTAPRPTSSRASGGSVVTPNATAPGVTTQGATTPGATTPGASTTPGGNTTTTPGATTPGASATPSANRTSAAAPTASAKSGSAAPSATSSDQALTPGSTDDNSSGGGSGLPQAIGGLALIGVVGGAAAHLARRRRPSELPE